LSEVPLFSEECSDFPGSGQVDSFRGGVYVQKWTDLSFLEKGIQTPMAPGRSTKIIPMMKRIRTDRLSRENSLFDPKFNDRCRIGISTGEVYAEKCSDFPGSG